MNKSKYEQKKRECFEEAVLHGALEVDKDLLFDHAFKCGYALGKQEKDAEGEEMLTVPRSQMQKLYASTKKVNDPSSKDYINGILNTLDTLFGSKCLPDEQSSVPSTKSDVPSSEPKYHIGQKVKFKDKDFWFEITAIEKWDDCDEYKYKLAGWKRSYRESDLEPYTEPEEKSRNLSQETANCDKMFDNILKDSFSKERRLNIAAMAMQGILSNPQLLKIAIETYQEEIGSPDIYVAVAKAAKEQVDALVAECEKGGADEKD